MGDGGPGRGGSRPPTAARARYAEAFATLRQSHASLGEELAATTDRVAATFEHGARVRERIAECGGPGATDFRLWAAQCRTVATFERQQAQALRSGRVLAVPWARPARDDRRGRPPTRPAG